MTMSSQKEKTVESSQRIKVSFRSEESGMRYLKHDDEGDMESIAAASNKEVKSSSAEKKMQKATTSSPRERKEDTEGTKRN